MFPHPLLVFMLWQEIFLVAVASPEILVTPANLTVGLGSTPIVIPCQIRGQILYWVVNGELYGTGNVQTLRNRGITITHPTRISEGVLTSRATVTATERNNNTVLICEAQIDGFDIVSSEPATIFIAGIPLAPSPIFFALDASTVGVEWDAPFTWLDFPITNYTVRVINQTSDEIFISKVLTADILSYNITLMVPPSCTNLTFSIIANSDVGASLPGIAQGAFPFSPGVFLESPRHEVTFSQDFNPILNVNFTFPSLCSYHNATYQVVIRTRNGMVVLRDGPYVRHWRETNSFATIELRERGLQLDRFYTANITVSTLGGHESIEITFDTALPISAPADTVLPTTDTLLPATASVAPDDGSGYGITEIVTSCIGTIVLMIALIGLTVCGIYIYRRNVKRRRDHVNITEHNLMVPNPIYEGAPIYEEIPGDLRSFKSLHHPPTGKTESIKPTSEREEGYASMSTSGVSNWDFPLPEKFDQECVATDRQDETYTVMNSAGPLLKLEPGQASILLNTSENVATMEMSEEKNTEHEDRYIII